MFFLVDAQLPPALCRLLIRQGHQAEHVQDVGLRDSDDSAIWSYAGRRGQCIVTKDEDFAVRAALHPDGPPILWLRVGNCTNTVLAARLAPLLPDVAARFKEGERVVEIV